MIRFSIFLAAAVSVITMTAQQVVCHRGMWNEPGSAQNSIRSLVKADSIGAWGSEFDVWMTQDGALFVNHDPTLQGVEIQSSKSGDVENLTLSNGERIPTFSKMLNCAQSLNTKLVVELKRHTGKNGKEDQNREKKAVKEIVRIVHELGLESRVVYISFSSYAVAQFIAEAPAGTEVYFLDGKRGSDASNGEPVYLLEKEMTLERLHQMGAAGIDYRFEVLFSQPELIEKCHRMGMKVNVWTVDNPQHIRWCVEHKVDYITTNDPVTTQLYIDAARTK